MAKKPDPKTEKADRRNIDAEARRRNKKNPKAAKGGKAADEDTANALKNIVKKLF